MVRLARWYSILLFCLPLSAQQLHITADLLSAKTESAMFGKLPKPYNVAATKICSNANTPATVPLARVAQEAEVKGIVLLPRDAALAVIAASQGSSLGQKLLRGGMAAIELAAIASTWSTLSMTIKNTLTASALAGAQGLSVLSTTIPTHVLLSFDHEALPDPLQLPALGCASGIVIVESASNAQRVDTTIDLGATK